MFLHNIFIRLDAVYSKFIVFFGCSGSAKPLTYAMHTKIRRFEVKPRRTKTFVGTSEKNYLRFNEGKNICKNLAYASMHPIHTASGNYFFL